MLLTDREKNVLRLVVDGKHNRQIAEILGIKVNTVKSYKTRIGWKYRKFGIRNLNHLMALYRKKKKEEGNAADEIIKLINEENSRSGYQNQ
ncbi:MAG TPA: helix-turn-helix transcriptional regulator [Chitinophagales bacterium]|nr:helix-turn-helix transcriptional regulator [Chitinophagales bacterium]